MNELEALNEALLISEAREQAIALDKKRLTVSHILTLHRDSASAADFRALLDHLTAAGMPDTATVNVDGRFRTEKTSGHIRMSARWGSEPK